MSGMDTERFLASAAELLAVVQPRRALGVQMADGAEAVLGESDQRGGAVVHPSERVDDPQRVQQVSLSRSPVAQ